MYLLGVKMLRTQVNSNLTDLNSAEADYLVLPFCKNEALPGKVRAVLSCMPCDGS